MNLNVFPPAQRKSADRITYWRRRRSPEQRSPVGQPRLLRFPDNFCSWETSPGQHLSIQVIFFPFENEQAQVIILNFAYKLIATLHYQIRVQYRISIKADQFLVHQYFYLILNNENPERISNRAVQLEFFVFFCKCMYVCTYIHICM